jgi:hypothetical protein
MIKLRSDVVDSMRYYQLPWPKVDDGPASGSASRPTATIRPIENLPPASRRFLAHFCDEAQDAGLRRMSESATAI